LWVVVTVQAGAGGGAECDALTAPAPIAILIPWEPSHLKAPPGTIPRKLARTFGPHRSHGPDSRCRKSNCRVVILDRAVGHAFVSMNRLSISFDSRFGAIQTS